VDLPALACSSSSIGQPSTATAPRAKAASTSARVRTPTWMWVMRRTAPSGALLPSPRRSSPTSISECRKQGSRSRGSSPTGRPLTISALPLACSACSASALAGSDDHEGRHLQHHVRRWPDGQHGAQPGLGGDVQRQRRGLCASVPPARPKWRAAASPAVRAGSGRCRRLRAPARPASARQPAPAHRARHRAVRGRRSDGSR
jgi:hypothetical protein